MNAHRAVNFALTFGLTVGIAAILSTGHLLDDHSADWPESTALADAQRAARAAYLKEKSDARQCTHLHGPGAAMRYTADGDLVCSTKRGGGAVVVATGGAK